MYYHVRLDYYDSRLRVNQTKYVFDYESEEDVVAEVLAPYLNKKDFFFHGCSISGDGQSQLLIYQTEQPIEDVVSRANYTHTNPLFDYDEEGVLEFKEFAKDVTRSLFNKYGMAVKEQKKSPEIEKSKKIFISHSSEDKEFAKALVNLLMLMGFAKDEIYCSSVPGVWITDGKDFLDDIKKQFTKHNLFVIFIQSPRFYGSHIALCEMGATWVGNHEFSSFLTSDMPLGDIDAVVRSSIVAVKVNEEESEARMNDWKNRILKWFNKESLDENLWMSQSRDFLKTANSFTYTQPEEDTGNDEKLTEADEEKLRMWIDSGEDKLYQAWEEGGSAFFGLGAKYTFPVENGPEMSKWKGFFRRMLKFGLMEKSGYTKDGKHPAYRLTEKAYEYFEL